MGFEIPESGANRTLSAASAVLISLAATFALLLCIQLAQTLLPSGSTSLSLAALIELCVYFGGCLLLRRYLGRSLRERHEWGLFSPGWSSLVIALLLGFSLHGPADFIQVHVERLYPLPEALRDARATGLSPNTLYGRVVLLLAAAVMVPIAEEAFFRGALYVGLRRGSTAFNAVVFTAVCFTLSHVEPRLWPALSLVAFVLSMTRERTGSLLPSILLHAAFNATTLIVTFSYPQALREPATPSPVWAALGTAMSVGLWLLLSRTAPERGGVR